MGSGDSSTLMSSGISLLQTPTTSKTSTVVVAEGIPPVACRLVEKLRKWEYINLTDFLKDHTTPEQFIVVNGQVMSLHTDQRPRSSKDILYILSWLQAFSMFSTVLLSSEDTTKEEAAGLAVHSYLILQMSKDLRVSQWYQYDQNFHEWTENG